MRSGESGNRIPCEAVSVDLDKRHAADALDAVSRAVAEWSVDLHWQRDATMADRYGPRGRQLWCSEVQIRTAHLAEAVAADRPRLFQAHAEWSTQAFQARHCTVEDLARSTECHAEVLSERLPQSCTRAAVEMLRSTAPSAARAQAAGSAPPRPRLAPEACRYLLDLMERRPDGAAARVLELRRRGTPLAEVLGGVLAPALVEVGRMWQMQEATVADEHYCSACTLDVLARLRAEAPPVAPNGRRAVAAAVAGDLHHLGVRMVADLLADDGWSVEYLGANMPSLELAEAVSATDGRPAPDLLALGASTTLMVRAAADAVATVRAATAGRDAPLPVMVGGLPFSLVPDLWQVIGADGHAACAADVLPTARRLVGAAR